MPVGSVASDLFPLTAGQAIYHSALQRRPESRTPVYLSFRIDGPLDVDALLCALRNLTSHHEVLRIGFAPLRDIYPMQYLRETPADASLITCEQVVSSTDAQFTEYVSIVLASDIAKPFDLYRDYPFRYRLLRSNEQRHALLGVFSRFAMDRQGRSIFQDNLWRLYAQHSQNHARSQCTQPETDLRTDKFAAACRRYYDHDNTVRRDRADRYWKAQSKKLSSCCEFSSPMKPELPAADVIYETFAVRGAALARLRHQARASACSEFQWVMSAFATTIFDVTSQDTIAINVPTDARTNAERDVIGMFTVTLPIIVNRPAEREDLPAQIRNTILAAIAHRRISPETAASMQGDVADGDGSRRAAIRASYLDMAAGQALDVDRLTIFEGAYKPRLTFMTEGLGLEVSRESERLTLELAFDPLVFSSSAGHDFRYLLDNHLGGAS